MLSVRKVKVSLPESMWWDVERLAKQTGQRVDQVIVVAVESYLGHEDRAPHAHGFGQRTP
jgi:metal-responsive CopG/Arc/MetJ family transcriptional regulator